MKFRDPKTGEVFDTIGCALDKICAQLDGCHDGCRLNEYNYGPKNKGRSCEEWANKYPREAAAIMGYELVGDNTNGATEPSNQSLAKLDTGKPRPTLVPVSLINAVTAVREYGVQKYNDPDNWITVETQRYRDALYRHWLAYLGGEYNDRESGLPHLWHVACNVAFLIELDVGAEQ